MNAVAQTHKRGAPLWESETIHVGGVRAKVQALGGMVVLTLTGEDKETTCLWTPRAAIAAASAYTGYAEALVNAANRVQQAIDSARVSQASEAQP